MTDDPAALDPADAPPTAAEAPGSATTPNLDEPGVDTSRGATSVLLVVAFALTVVFLFAIAALTSAPGGGCGGG